MTKGPVLALGDGVEDTPLEIPGFDEAAARAEVEARQALWRDFDFSIARSSSNVAAGLARMERLREKELEEGVARIRARAVAAWKREQARSAKDEQEY